MAKRVIVELRAPVNFTMHAAMNSDLAKLPGFEIDPKYEPVPVNPPKEMVESLGTTNEKVFLIRGVVEDEKEEELKSSPNVLNVWSDAPIEPF
jgi:hypothetical protein